MSTNAFRATLADDTPVGLCFEPTVALANHSCYPNAVVLFDGRCLSLRALNSIQKGEEILVSYVDPTESRDLRREKLKARYFFTCECEKCVGNENPYQLLLKHLNDGGAASENMREQFFPANLLISKAISHIQHLETDRTHLSKTIEGAFQGLSLSRNASNQHDELKFLSSILSQDSPVISQDMVAIPPFPSIYHALYLNYLDQPSYLPSLIILLFMFLHCDVFTYPQPHHPVRVIRLWSIARLLKHVASFNQADFVRELDRLGMNRGIETRKTLEGLDFIDAFEVVVGFVRAKASSSHGQGSAFWREVEEEVRDVEEVQRLRGHDKVKQPEKVLGGLRRLAECMSELLKT